MNFKLFLEKKNVKASFKTYVVEASSNMALGLFSTLLIGTILNTIGGKLGISFLTDTVWPAARNMTGPAIAVAISYGLKAPFLVILSSTITGSIAYATGGPIGAYIAAIVGTEVGKMISKETKVDIIVTPAVTIIVGALSVYYVGPVMSRVMVEFGKLIMLATSLHPFFMGIIVSVVMGIVLTLPISSAALAVMISLSGLAAGAATVGCSTQMIGFAVMSFKVNGWGGLLAQGLGTSMLQIPNITKNWKIWLPPIIASAILGPLSTVYFKFTNIPIGAGMGTSGLVGQFGTVTSMTAEQGELGVVFYISLIMLHFILPAVLTLFIAKYMKTKGMFKDEDLKLDL